MIKFCRFCGAKLAEGAQFCGKCGNTTAEGVDQTAAGLSDATPAALTPAQGSVIGQPPTQPVQMPAYQQPAAPAWQGQPAAPVGWPTAVPTVRQRKPFPKWALGLCIGGPILVVLVMLGIIFGPKLFSGSRGLTFPLAEGTGVPERRAVIRTDNVVEVIEIARWAKGLYWTLNTRPMVKPCMSLQQWEFTNITRPH
jgi:hypothetical protein